MQRAYSQVWCVAYAEERKSTIIAQADRITTSAKQSQVHNSPHQEHRTQLRLGIWIEIFTISWMTIEAAIAIITGYVAHSVSLQGFGIDSIIELIAGAVLLWRLLIEQRGGGVALVERAERRASWITAFSLFGLAIYIVGDSAFTLLSHSRPQASWWGIGLTLAAAIIMPLLWQAKMRIAKRIDSVALKADAACIALFRRKEAVYKQVHYCNLGYSPTMSRPFRV